MSGCVSYITFSALIKAGRGSAGHDGQGSGLEGVEGGGCRWGQPQPCPGGGGHHLWFGSDQYSGKNIRFIQLSLLHAHGCTVNPVHYGYRQGLFSEPIARPLHLDWPPPLVYEFAVRCTISGAASTQILSLKYNIKT